VRGGCSAPLLHSDESPLGVLHPALEPSAKKEILYPEGGEALEQVAQRSYGCPLPEMFKARMDGAWSNLV